VLASGGAAEPAYAPAPALAAEFSVSPLIIEPRQTVTFTAKEAPGAQYNWLFGDGASAHGHSVRHRFPDALGTELDGRNGAGRFRVLLHVTDKAGHQDWAAQGVVVVEQLHDAVKTTTATVSGLNWKLYAGAWTELPDFSTIQPALTGLSPGLFANAPAEAEAPGPGTQVDSSQGAGGLNAGSQTLGMRATVWDGWINISADGGYTFHLIDRDGERLTIDGMEVAKTGPPFGLVCGAAGNALRYDRGSIGLRAGLHAIHVEALNTATEGAPRLLWEGPGLALEDVPATALSHSAP
jgi:PKD domain